MQDARNEPLLVERGAARDALREMRVEPCLFLDRQRVGSASVRQSRQHPMLVATGRHVFNSFLRRARARKMRDSTVPIGAPVISAIAR